MQFPQHFLRATTDYSTLTHFVPAPCFRKSFTLEAPAVARVVIGACGFYELFLNGQRRTKGALAPYISNPDDIVYYDAYTLPLQAGENVIGVVLGNGFQNNPGGYIWDFDKSPFRGAPQFALSVSWIGADGKVTGFESDESFRTAPSAITFDDYRFGEHYDARLEQPGWNAPGFDDSGWAAALPAPNPRGEKRLCEAEPIVVTETRQPVSVTPMDGGYCYDFGVNAAGVCRLTVSGAPGQKIELFHGEWIKPDGTLDRERVWFHREEDLWQRDKDLIHRDIYVCRGDETETYIPRFTYHGFRYVLVTGITPAQATPSLLTYQVMNSDLKERGGFSCSCETVNKLQECTRRSDLANFYYFPTDCPQREKNGWTADAALSTEHVLLNLSAETSYREWMRNICKAQADDGRLPGIVPTSGWGIAWGNGPAWDSILAYLPYFVYVYRGKTEMIADSAGTFLRYLHYLTTRADENGLLAIGLGDWCPVGRGAGAYLSPLEFTDTVMAMDIARKIAFLFDAVGMAPERDYAEAVAKRFRTAIRTHLIDFATMTASGNCQTSQAMAIFYDVFEPGEKPAAFRRLLDFIHEKQDFMDVGVLGARVLFHVLSQFGETDLALRMIIRPEFPAYGNWLKHDATSLWESFYGENSAGSRNHHFWGDISSWFIQYLAGIRLNPTGRDVNRVDIAPCFAAVLDHAEGFHIAPAGRIETRWVRENDVIRLTITVPAAMKGRIRLEPGWCFDDGLRVKPLASGTYIVQGI